MRKRHSLIPSFFVFTLLLLPFLFTSCHNCQQKTGSSGDLARCKGNIFKPESQTDNDIKDLIENADNIKFPSEVEISDDSTKFKVFQTEVTNEQFASFLREKGTKKEETKDGKTNDCNLDDDQKGLCYQYGGGGKDGGAKSRINEDYSVKSGYGDHPVNYVSWYAADSYCKAIDKRLPTEAEWKLIAKGNDSDVYPWGDSPDCASVHAKVEDSSKYCDPTDTIPVTEQKGIAKHDDGDVLNIAGNVAEWIADKIGKDEDSATKNKDKKRLAKGGSWDSNADSLKIEASGRRLTPSATDHNIGFRCVSN